MEVTGFNWNIKTQKSEEKRLKKRAKVTGTRAMKCTAYYRTKYGYKKARYLKNKARYL